MMDTNRQQKTSSGADWRRAAIRDHLKKLSSVEYLREAYLGDRSRYYSSPVETWCMLFDDYSFEDFIEKQLRGDVTATALASRLIDLMDNFPKPLPEERNEIERCITTEGWQEIMIAAGKLAEVL